jgi:hypothetical protein
MLFCSNNSISERDLSAAGTLSEIQKYIAYYSDMLICKTGFLVAKSAVHYIN